MLRCGKPGHFRRYCRQMPPENRDQDVMKGPSSSSNTPPRFTLSILGKGTEDSLIADGWIQEKPCRVHVDTGACDHRQARHHRRTARKEAESTVHPTNGVQWDNSSREGSAHTAEPWAVHS
jgi:hypothetical protein